MVDRNYKSGKEKYNNEKEERSFGSKLITKNAT
jgi:hypothetical protein